MIRLMSVWTSACLHSCTQGLALGAGFVQSPEAFAAAGFQDCRKNVRMHATHGMLALGFPALLYDMSSAVIDVC